MSWYQPKSYVIEAKQLHLYNVEEIERFVGGDTGVCPLGEKACLIVATHEGPLHVTLGSFVMKYPDGKFKVMTSDEFNSKYDLIQRDPYGD